MECWQPGSRLFDIAYLMILVQAKEEIERQVLATYLEVDEVPELEWAKYFIMKQFTRMHCIIFAIALCEDFNFLEELERSKKLGIDLMEPLPSFQDLTVSIYLEQKLNLQSDFGHYQLAYMYHRDLEKAINDPRYKESLALIQEEHRPALRNM